MANEFGPALTTITRGIADPVTGAYDTSLLPSLINLGYSEGMGGRGMLAAFKAAGVPITTRAFWAMAGDVRDARANVEQVAGLNLAEVPGVDAFAKWNTSHVSGWYYRVRAQFERPGIRPGTTDTITKLWGYRSSVRLALGDVFSDLYDAITGADTEGDSAEETLVGMTLDNMYEMSP